MEKACKRINMSIHKGIKVLSGNRSEDHKTDLKKQKKTEKNSETIFMNISKCLYLKKDETCFDKKVDLKKK